MEILKRVASLLNKLLPNLIENGLMVLEKILFMSSMYFRSYFLLSKSIVLHKGCFVLSFDETGLLFWKGRWKCEKVIIVLRYRGID